jgi:hypothetical protein
MIMRQLSGEKGVALVVVLAMVVLSAAMFAVVLHFIQRGTETSGIDKRYETAKEASLGAIDVFAKEIIPMAIAKAQFSPDTSLTDALVNFSKTGGNKIEKNATSACFSDKLLKSTANWGAGCDSSPQPKAAPDVTFTLTGTDGQPFVVYTKIVDTVAGNSNTSGVSLEGAGVVDSMSAMVSVQHFPYMYSMEVQGERASNPTGERAAFEVLYAF